MWSKYEVQRMEARRRDESLRSKRREQDVRRYEAELSDQEQGRRERRERWELEKKEREIRLKHGVWREWIEIGTALFFLLCAVVLLIGGIRSGQPSILAGSGVTGLLWTLHLSSSRRKGSVTG